MLFIMKDIPSKLVSIVNPFKQDFSLTHQSGSLITPAKKVLEITCNRRERLAQITEMINIFTVEHGYIKMLPHVKDHLFASDVD